MNGKYNVLFLCTGNSARSIMAEMIANQLGRDRLRAYSAGSQPAGRVHPLALELLKKVGFSTEDARSKSWNEFSGSEAPVMDFIITLCDRARDEPCPVWPGHPITAHWNVPDPAAVDGTPEQNRKAFQLALQVLQQRISLMLALRLEALDRLAIETRLSQLGMPPIDQSA
ncbi:MAG TPA: arsenate reductase ArsC [Arenimonas sp.]|nr:arsenate reductase ArsC [Arenimonas sp.]HPW33718.1 arsenate reductase ArsC [Arenimonas sp.]